MMATKAFHKVFEPFLSKPRRVHYSPLHLAEHKDEEAENVGVSERKRGWSTGIVVLLLLTSTIISAALGYVLGDRLMRFSKDKAEGGPTHFHCCEDIQ